MEAATWDVVTAPPPAEEAPGEPVAPGEEQSEGTPIPFLMPTEDGSLQVAGTTPAAAFVPTSLPSATAFDSTLLTPTGTVSPSPVADRAAAASTFIVATGGLMVIAVGLILVWRQSHDPDST